MATKTTRKPRAPRKAKCPVCHGKGKYNKIGGAMWICPICDGPKEDCHDPASHDYDWIMVAVSTRTVQCKACGGEGK